MRMKWFLIASTVGLLQVNAAEPSIFFDFENAPIHTSLPIALTAGGITAQFSATGQGFSIQPANSMGFTPVGFAGNCIYPNSIYAADLVIGFSRAVTDFSILYAPQELACDSSARMRVTAYLNGTSVGSNTTNAVAGTWPSETLGISSPQGFDKVVIHYDAPPPTGGDYGCIFMADNMSITPTPPPIVLTSPIKLAHGAFQFAFTNTPDTKCSVLATTNLSLPVGQWNRLGNPAQVSPGCFQFTDTEAATGTRRFYRICSP